MPKDDNMDESSIYTGAADTPRAVTPLAINAAFLQEIKQDNLDYSRSIARCKSILTDQVHHGFSLQRFLIHLGRLRDQLNTQFALEEQFGYFEDALVVAPELSALAGTLRAEHLDFHQAIDRLIQFGESIIDQPQCAEFLNRFRACSRRFIKRLERHEHREIQLIQRAYLEDVGVCD